MIAPLYSFGLIADSGIAAILLILGFCLGYLLESAGLADAKNVATTLFGRDLRMLEVIFSAMLTTLILTLLAFYFGMLDMALIPPSSLFLGTQIVGGLILGVGLVLGGYLPGTEIIAAVTRKYDAWVFIAGSFAGMILYAEFYSAISGLSQSWQFGAVTLGELFNLSSGVAALIAILGTIVLYIAIKIATGKAFADKSQTP